MKHKQFRRGIMLYTPSDVLFGDTRLWLKHILIDDVWVFKGTTGVKECYCETDIKNIIDSVIDQEQQPTPSSRDNLPA